MFLAGYCAGQVVGRTLVRLARGAPTALAVVVARDDDGGQIERALELEPGAPGTVTAAFDAVVAAEDAGHRHAVGIVIEPRELTLITGLVVDEAIFHLAYAIDDGVARLGALHSKFQERDLSAFEDGFSAGLEADDHGGAFERVTDDDIPDDIRPILATSMRPMVEHLLGITGSAFLWVWPEAGVELPAHLPGDEEVVLTLVRDEVDVDDRGLIAMVPFDGRPFRCVVPWTAMAAVAPVRERIQYRVAASTPTE